MAILCVKVKRLTIYHFRILLWINFRVCSPLVLRYLEIMECRTRQNPAQIRHILYQNLEMVFF